MLTNTFIKNSLKTNKYFFFGIWGDGVEGQFVGPRTKIIIIHPPPPLLYQEKELFMFNRVVTRYISEIKRERSKL